MKLDGKGITLAALLGAVTTAGLVWAAEEQGAFGGKVDPSSWNKGLSVGALNVHKLSDEMYTERWNFVFDLADGTHIFTSFAIANAGLLSDFNGTVETTVLRKDGTAKFFKTDVDDVEYEKDKFALKFDDSYFKANGKTYDMAILQKDIKVKLTIQARALGFIPGNGTGCFDDDCDPAVRQVVLFTNGHATGTLEFEGKTTKVDATVYADHGWSNNPPQNTADHLYAMRSFEGTSTMSLLVYRTPKKTAHRLMGFVSFTDGNKNKFVTHRLQAVENGLTPDPKKTSYKLPKLIQLKSLDGDPTFAMTLSLDKQMQRQDAISDFNFAERTLIKTFVAEPILYRFDASYDASYQGEGTQPTQRKGSGVLEYMIINAAD